MTFSDKALGNGWHDQAARLVGIHGVLGPKGKRSSLDDDSAAREAGLNHELERAAAQIARLELRLEQEAAEAVTLRQHVALLDKQFEDAEQRADELEGELAVAYDSAARHDNECQSLRLSLDLATAENAQLTQNLEQSDAALYDARAELARLQDTDEGQSPHVALDLAIAENAQLAQSLEASEAALGAASADLTRLRTTLTETANERSKLASELFETNGKRLNEIAELRDQLAAMSARAETAERLLTDARECLATGPAEKAAVERGLAETAAARRDADSQVKQLQDLLRIKQCQLNELEQSRDKLEQSRDKLEQSRGELEQSRDELLSATNALLKTCQNRDTALAQADERIDVLTQRIAQLEAQALEASRRKTAAPKAAATKTAAKAATKAAKTQPPPPAASRIPADDTADNNRIKWAALAVELAKLVKLEGELPQPLEAGSTDALLASTITF
jgi:chromosome segregation ATPase